MDLMRCILTQNDCYRRNNYIKPKGIMVHSTGCNNTHLSRYVQPSPDDPNKEELERLLGENRYGNDWNQPNLKVCVHGFIGKLADGSIATVQTLPWDRFGWHCAGAANGTHISFEICEDGLNNRTYFNQVYKAAVELVAHLCALYGFNPLEDGVVICHSEGYRRGIANNHGDVEHWWPRFGKTMNNFRADVAKKMKEGNGVVKKPETFYKTYKDVPTWYQPVIKKLMDAGVLNGKDAKGTIDVSETYCRVMTTLDRLGKL